MSANREVHVASLTPRMAECLRVISAEIAETGVAPTYEQLCAMLGLRAKSHAYRLVIALEERRWLKRIPGRARAMRVLRHLPSPPKPATARHRVIRTGDILALEELLSNGGDRASWEPVVEMTAAEALAVSALLRDMASRRLVEEAA